MRTLKQTFWPHLILLATVLILFTTNYAPGTWLTGWDNLHPEFNFFENIINRSIWSTWQSYQGLGVRAGNAHAADLLRQLGLWATSFVLPASILRYFYHFFALFVGSIGVYELITRKLIRGHGITSQLAGLMGGLFALLNLGTMQNFSVPYEAFSHTFASLPWLLLCLFSVLDRPMGRSWILFALASLLATPMFYIPTMFLVYLGIISIIILLHAILHKTSRVAKTIFVIIFVVNAYWLLPFIAFVSHGTGFVSEAKINRIFTEEAFLRNQKFGALSDIALLKGFLFDTTDMADTTSGRNEFLMKPWIEYLGKPTVYWLHVGIFGAIILGFGIALRKRLPHAGTMAIVLILTIIALISDNPPTGWLFGFLQERVPLFKQVFRFPYTKFIVPAILTYAIGFAYAIFFLIGRRRIVLPFLIALLVFLNWPSFAGNFIYPAMRQQLPKEYQELFVFFRGEPSTGKIANLPQPTFWGWTTYDWGYRGSGFPWYGIPQPILDRAFDVWNPSNERYFNDLTQAIYTQQSPEALEKFFDTYHISYAWLDERVVLPHKPGLLFYEEIKSLFAASSRFTKVFERGKQTVYRFDPNKPISDVSLASSFTASAHPFVDSSRLVVQEDATSFTVTAPVSSGQLTIPAATSMPWAIPARATKRGSVLRIEAALPEIRNNGVRVGISPPGFVEISQGALAGYLQINDALVDSNNPQSFLLYPTQNTLAIYPSTPTYTEDISQKFFNKELHNCLGGEPSANTLFGRNTETSDFLTLFGRESSPCVYAKLSDVIAQKRQSGAPTGLIGLSVEYKPEGTEDLRLCLSRSGETGCFFETYGAASTVLSDGWKTLNVLVPIREYPLDDVWLKLELDARGSEEKRISYRNMRLNLFTRPLVQERFAVKGQAKDVSVPVQSGQLSLVFAKSLFGQTQLAATDLPKTKRNCFSLGKGTYDKTFQTDAAQGPFIRYSAQDASSCDYFPLAAAAIKSGGIASYVTRTISGRPLKTCIKIDPPGYCLVEDFVKAVNHAWTKTSFFIPPVNPNIQTTYYMETDNYAVGRELRINDLASLSFLPVPYSWMRALSLASPSDYQEINAMPVQTDYENPTFVKVNLPRVQSNATLLTLYQSFDPGWVAIQNGKPLTRHVLVNNWANGWILAGTNGTIYIFFWPQLLEFLGFALLPIPFLFLLRKNRL